MARGSSRTRQGCSLGAVELQTMGASVLRGIGIALGAGVVALLASAGPQAVLLVALLAAGVVAMALVASLVVSIVRGTGRGRGPGKSGG